MKFQTSVPATGSSLPIPGMCLAVFTRKCGLNFRIVGPDMPERGTDETIEIISCICRMSDMEGLFNTQMELACLLIAYYLTVAEG